MRRYPISALFALCALFITLPRPSNSQTVNNASARVQSIGVARIDITPTEPIRLSGYGGRRSPSSGVGGKLWAKAIAIGDGPEPAVIVTLDLIGVPRWLTDAVVEQIKIPQSKFVLCATHTHSGPHLKNVLDPIFMEDIPEAHWSAIERYSARLVDLTVAACKEAIENRSPASMEWGQGEVGFAANRRVLENSVWTGFGIQPDGPVDHSLPILRINDAKGKLLSVFVNYACHCTTLEGDYNQIHGDWAGEAQLLIEKRHPGATALIAIGCGADANPNPRGSLDAVRQNAASLADEVDRLLKTNLIPLANTPNTRFERISLPLDPLPKRTYWEEHAASEIKTAHYAQNILERLDAGESLPTEIDYPIQTWTFGDDLAMVFLAGEVVVDYALALKERFDPDRIWINAYANASPSYISSRRLYDEGGYEVDRSMLYYDKPVRLSPDTEDLVLDEVLKQLPHTFYSERTLNAIPAPINKENALSTFELHPDLEIQLVAAEPLVADPIDIAWGSDGRLWVVEMGDYPLGPAEDGQGGDGRIRILEDIDQDGVFDRSILFADKLNFPTSIFPWKDGVLFTAAPDLIYATDIDNDGRADTFKTLYTGFTEGNQQHLINGMQWGLDGWIYLANGDSGGTVHSIGSGSSVDIDGRDLRIKPETGEIEAIMGRSQFGRNRDSWGNWFGNSNSWPGWHFALEDSYLHRNPFLKYATGRSFLPQTPQAGRVFPSSKTLSRFNDYEKANRFTSACGFMIYDDPTLGPAFEGNSFVSEPVHNLVSRAIVRPHGTTFTSERAPEERTTEFLRSTDNWFRPAAIRSGPDGALYVVDMYRLAIEHPEWIPQDWQRKLNLREGKDKGRIYRITRRGASPMRTIDIRSSDTDQLMKLLVSPIRWQRDQAQQVFLSSNSAEVDTAIEAVTHSASDPKAQIQALWTLALRHSFAPDTLVNALTDSHPYVRKHAIQLSEPFLHSKQVLDSLHKLVDDPSPQVRIQLAYTLGQSTDEKSADTLFELFQSNHQDPFIASAVLSSIPHHLDSLVKTLNSRVVDPDLDPLRNGLIRTALGTGKADVARNALSAFLSHRSIDLERHLATYLEFQSVQAAVGRTLDSELETRIQSLMRRAAETVQSESALTELRILSLRTLAGQSPAPDSLSTIALSCLQASNPFELQEAAIQALSRIHGSQVPQILLSQWESRSPRIRNEILTTLLSRATWSRGLLEIASSQSEIAKSLSIAQRNQLLRNAHPDIRDRAEQVLNQDSLRNRRQVVDDYQDSLQLTGDPQSGSLLYTGLCASCHQFGDIGKSVGPDLSALSDRSATTLLEAILDPNKAVENKFIQFTATTNDQRSIVGILSEETATTATLITTGGIAQTILRRDLRSLESNSNSLMPEGFESALAPQQMADLLAFLDSDNTVSPIRADDDGEIALTAKRATISGSSAYYNENTDAIEWIQSEDSIQWTVHDLAPGNYDIFGDAGLKDRHAGRPFTLHMNDTFVTGAVPYSRGMDRFRKRKFGNIRIETHTQITVFKLEHSLPNAEFALKELRLIPVD